MRWRDQMKKRAQYRNCKAPVLPKKATEVNIFRDFDCKKEKRRGFYFRRIFWQHWGRSLWEQKTKTKTPENLRFCFSPVKNAQKAKYEGPFLFFFGFEKKRNISGVF